MTVLILLLYIIKSVFCTLSYRGTLWIRLKSSDNTPDMSNDLISETDYLILIDRTVKKVIIEENVEL